MYACEYNYYNKLVMEMAEASGFCSSCFGESNRQVAVVEHSVIATHENISQNPVSNK